MHHPTPSTTTTPEYCSPSPAKRRKLVTPSAAFTPTSSIFRHRTPAPTPDPHFDFDELDAERRASSVRLLNTWSALQEKYARPPDKDDIFDIPSGIFVKDRGVLRSAPRTWDIGCFADEHDSESQRGGTPDISDDELGTWETDSEFDARFALVHVPPVRELDPLDTEDLKEFLAAEKARKLTQETDEEEEEEEEDDDDDDDFDGAISKPASLLSPSPSNIVDLTQEDDESDLEVIEVEAGSALVVSSSESDDELYGYDDSIGEGAILWRVDDDSSTGKHKPVPLHREPSLSPSKCIPEVVLPLRRAKSVRPSASTPSRAITPSSPSPVQTRPSQPPPDLWSNTHPDPRMYLAQLGFSYLFGVAPPNPPFHHDSTGSTFPPSWPFPPPVFTTPFTFSSPVTQPPPSSPLTPCSSRVTSAQLPSSSSSPPLRTKCRSQTKRVSFPQHIGVSEEEEDGDQYHATPKATCSIPREAARVSSNDKTRSRRKSVALDTDRSTLKKDKGKGRILV